MYKTKKGGLAATVGPAERPVLSSQYLPGYIRQYHCVAVSHSAAGQFH